MPKAVPDRDHIRGLATHAEDPTPEQMAHRQKEFFASMAKK